MMANYDPETGIRFGVVSPHSISQYALDDIYTNGTDPHYENAKNELMDDIKALCDNHGINFDRVNTDSFIDEFNDHFESCGDGQMDYSDSEYTLHVSGDNFGIFVMKSPYYTYCRGCSPCAPGAGDLDNPSDVTLEDDGSYESMGDPTLCLGPEWFNEDNPIPYQVFRVDNDQEVI